VVVLSDLTSPASAAKIAAVILLCCTGLWRGGRQVNQALPENPAKRI
jgi:hypothetical protein